MINIGPTAKNLREAVGWSQKATADALGISPVHLCNIEKGRAQPSTALLDAYRQLWGIDLYVLAWCELGKSEDLPVAIQSAATKLANAWRKQVSEQIGKIREKDVHTCSTSEE